MKTTVEIAHDFPGVGVVVNVDPIPKAVVGEPLGATKQTLVAEALHREHC